MISALPELKSMINSVNFIVTIFLRESCDNKPDSKKQEGLRFIVIFPKKSIL